MGNAASACVASAWAATQLRIEFAAIFPIALAPML
jgi:hypothetical protein